MELTIDEYGKYLFHVMTKEKYSSGSHWESIRKEAEPLVRQLIELNKKMEGGGYKLVGYVDESGKKILSDHERVCKAQDKLWKTTASTLKKGDKIWLYGGDRDMHIGEDEPAVVETVTKEWIYIMVKDWEDVTEKIHKRAIVYKAPKDWSKKEELYSSDEFWLEQADKLGI